MPSDGSLASVGEGARPALPVPPLDLRERVGGTTFPDDPVSERLVRRAPWWDADPEQSWLRQGRHLVDRMRDQLPADFSLTGARVLDFGCGAGRVLRHLPEVVGEAGELHGVDIDGPSIAWLQANTAPTLQAVQCDELPGLPYSDGCFDLVYAYSVFTHVVEHWAGWLLELRRVLKPGGVLLATVIGRETAGELGLADVGSDAGGMYARMLGNDWRRGGPVSIHDRAWVAERWGRAFEIVSHAARVTGQPWPHDIVVARPLPGEIGEDDLLAAGADGDRDGKAATAQLRLLRADALLWRASYDGPALQAVAAIAHSRAEVEGSAAARIAELSERYAALDLERAKLESAGWRITRPGRARERETAPDGDAR